MDKLQQKNNHFIIAIHDMFYAKTLSLLTHMRKTTTLQIYNMYAFLQEENLQFKMFITQLL